ncbi:hypothetical protein TKK_0007076 [Trichogramma kaykai]|uniref:RxLR effector protein n=1 Tax=Trichogramma kaykai TaxID=54128 RepID=A0ABD2XB88_9HYME
MYKFVLLLVALCAVYSATAVPRDVENVVSTTDASTQTETETEEPADASLVLQPTPLSLGQRIDRLRKGAKVTKQEQVAMLKEALLSVVDANKKKIAATMAVAKTGVDVVLMLPKFGKNILAQTQNHTASLL